MMKRILTNIRRVAALCLCLALLAGAACAEEITEIPCGAGGFLSYMCTLPDGRVLLAGGKRDSGNYTCVNMWLVCLNTDRTVSWEYTASPEEISNAYSLSPAAEQCGVYQAAALKDGTVAAVMIADTFCGPTHFPVLFLTQDGIPTGKRLLLADGCQTPYAAEPSFLMTIGIRGEGPEDETMLIDWDGNVTVRYDGLVVPGAYGFKIRGEDRLVTYGQDATENGHAVIAKMDAEGNVLWKTVLERLWPDTEDAQLMDAVQTGDGGYAACLREDKRIPESDEWEMRYALVKFDADGHVAWTNRTIWEKDGCALSSIYAHHGKILVYCPPDGSDDFGADGLSRCFRWFDEDGKDLGATGPALAGADYPNLKQYLDAGKDRMAMTMIRRVIPMEDSMWICAECNVREKQTDGDPRVIGESQEFVLVRLPEP